MGNKKEIPFDCDIIPVKEISIVQPTTQRIIKELYLVNLIISSHNKFRESYFKSAVNIIDEYDKPTNKAVVHSVIFDPSDNTMALYINSELKIIDYSEYGKKTWHQNSAKGQKQKGI